MRGEGLELFQHMTNLIVLKLPYHFALLTFAMVLSYSMLLMKGYA